MATELGYTQEAREWFMEGTKTLLVCLHLRVPEAWQYCHAVCDLLACSCIVSKS